MPAPYALPSGGNVTSFESLFLYINNSVAEPFSLLILIGVFLIPFIVLNQMYGSLRAFLVSSWTAFLVSIFMSMYGLVPQAATAAFLALSIVAIALVIWDKRR